ncbi:hypothetical protein HYT84_04820 [Candidatus Micrarchaeota archaeon]|nr:hypothetical protein [Candidatus Micrarchaeota archaeon]
MKIKNISLLVFSLFSLISILVAATSKVTGPETISLALAQTCGTIKGALAIGMLLLVVLAAIVYAVGQVMGAETRARASVWATAMFTGAIIGALIFILVPYVIQILMTGSASAETSWADKCCTTALDTEKEINECAKGLGLQ